MVVIHHVDAIRPRKRVGDSRVVVRVLRVLPDGVGCERRRTHLVLAICRLKTWTWTIQSNAGRVVFAIKRSVECKGGLGDHIGRLNSAAVYHISRTVRRLCVSGMARAARHVEAHVKEVL
jgi:hypothetical protein